MIPVKRNWHKDVGIEIEPDTYGTSAGADKIVSILTAGTVDIASGASVFALAGYNTNGTYISFGHGDIFQGFGFMVDPQQGYKNVDDFVGEGMEPPAAIKATAEQFRGKRLATLNEAGIRGFITIALETAGMSHGRHRGRQLRYGLEDHCRDGSPGAQTSPLAPRLAGSR